MTARQQSQGGVPPRRLPRKVGQVCLEGANDDLFVRLKPDVPLKVDGVRSTSDSFRDEIEMFLNAILPTYIPVDGRNLARCQLRASDRNCFPEKALPISGASTQTSRVPAKAERAPRRQVPPGATNERTSDHQHATGNHPSQATGIRCEEREKTHCGTLSSKRKDCS